MRKNLHPLLREGLDYEGPDTDPEDLLEPYPDSDNDSAYRAAKRRRVETIATGYIRGKVPIITTARLRGPFDRGWKNPWAPPRSDRKVVEAAHGTSIAQPSEDVKHGSLNELGNGNISIGNTDVTVTVAQASMKARSANLGVKVISRGKRQNAKGGTRPRRQIQTPSMSVVSESNECSVATEHNSADGGEQAPPGDTPNHMRWLRRRQPDDGPDLTDLNPLPTPSRKQVRTNGVPKEIQVGLSRSLPITASNSDPSPGRVQARPLDHHWHSSNSASMVISSPVGQATTDKSGRQATSPSPRSAKKSQIVPPRPVPCDKTIPDVTEQGTQPSGSPRASKVLPIGHGTPMSQPQETEHMGGICSADKQPGMDMANASSSKSRPVTREDIRRSAERCATVRPATSATRSGSAREQVSASKAKDLAKPSSSTSFIYRRIGDGRSTDRLTSKSNPRLMTFNSSPMVHLNEHSPVIDAPETEGTEGSVLQVEVGDEHVFKSPRSAPYDVIEDAQEVQEGSGSSRYSIQSTQTALMLAQMEFQNSAMHSLAPDEHPAWPSNHPHSSPWAAGEGRVAITPFRDFNAELDRRHPIESAIRGPPMSTQDLFAAASPFPLSTVKKRTGPAKRSSLRFAVLTNEPRDMRADTESGNKSPTPSAERIPLKERNSYIFVKGAMNGSQKGSQESALNSPARARKDLELLQLDFRTSLDGELNFTERFLDHLEGLG